MVKALDCGVRGHRFKSHQLLPKEGFSPRIFLLEFSLPTGEDLYKPLVLSVQSCPSGKNECKKKNKKKKRPILRRSPYHFLWESAFVPDLSSVVSSVLTCATVSILTPVIG